jgi:hypothetical protein
MQGVSISTATWYRGSVSRWLLLLFGDAVYYEHFAGGTRCDFRKGREELMMLEAEGAEPTIFFMSFITYES